MKGNGIIAADTTSCSNTRTRRRDLFELGGIYSLILLVIWTPRPWQAVLWVIVAAIVTYIAFLSFEGFAPMGLCTANLVRSLWAVAFAIAVAMTAVFLAIRLHTLHMPDTALLLHSPLRTLRDVGRGPADHSAVVLSLAIAAPASRRHRPRPH